MSTAGVYSLRVGLISGAKYPCVQIKLFVFVALLERPKSISFTVFKSPLTFNRIFSGFISHALSLFDASALYLLYSPSNCQSIEVV